MQSYGLCMTSLAHTESMFSVIKIGLSRFFHYALQKFPSVAIRLIPCRIILAQFNLSHFLMLRHTRHALPHSPLVGCSRQSRRESTKTDGSIFLILSMDDSLV